MSEAFLIPTVTTEQIEQMPAYDPWLRSMYDYGFEETQPALYTFMNTRLTSGMRVPFLERQPILNIYGFVYGALSRAVIADEGLLLGKTDSLPAVEERVYKKQLHKISSRIQDNAVSGVEAIACNQKPLFDYVIRNAQALPLSRDAFTHCRLASRALMYAVEDQLWRELGKRVFNRPT